MVRNPLIVAGLTGSAACIYLNNFRQVPVWWSADVGVGAALLITAGAVLILAQLAVGRARRDGMTSLYDSYPASPAVRAGGTVLGVAAPAVLAAVVAAAGVAFLDAEGAIGSPRLYVLAGALLLVPLGGALGAAIGSWLPHPLAGLLAAGMLTAVELDAVLSVYSLDGHGPGYWLLPWTWNRPLLNSMPSPVAAIPPPAHLAELAGLIALVVAITVWRSLPARRITGLVAAASLVLTGWSTWAQERPVPVSQVTRLVYEATRPDRTQLCSASQAVRYCYYPAFGPMVARWSVPVNAVLALLPARPGRQLTIRQPSSLIAGPPLIPVHSGSVLSTVEAGLGNYVNYASEPADSILTSQNWGLGSAAGVSQLALTAQVATWAVDPALSIASGKCLPLGQAREPIMIWLAAAATTATRAAYPASVTTNMDNVPTQVGKVWITSQFAADMQVTSQGLALAGEMLRQPVRRVEAVLAARWPGWLSPSITDGQLAAALGVPLPRLLTVRGLLPSGQVPGTNTYTTPSPPTAVCR
jgi:hypothetical protein